MKIGVINSYKPSSFAIQHFALLEKVGEDFNILCPFAQCRTWMSDALHKLKTGAGHPNYPIESKTYNYNKGSVHIGITFIDIKMKEIFLKNINFIHEKEVRAKVRKTTLMETTHPLTMIITGSKFWKDSVWKIQLYTMYLRIMCYVNLNLDYYTYMYEAITKNNNEDILLSKLKMKASSEVFTSMNTSVHSSTGPYAICSGDNPDMAKLLGVKV